MQFKNVKAEKSIVMHVNFNNIFIVRALVSTAEYSWIDGKMLRVFETAY